MHVLSASKDGTIYVWKILGDSANPDDRLSYAADSNLDEPLTRAKWLTSTCIVATTTHGNVYTLELSRDSQNALCLSRPVKVYSTEDEVAVWDMAVFSKNSKQEVWLAEDSGKVTQLSLASNEQISASKTVHVSIDALQSPVSPFRSFLSAIR